MNFLAMPLRASNPIYSREELLDDSGTHSEKHSIPVKIRRKYLGCQARAKLKAKQRCFKPSIPSIMMGNVNGLTNNTDILSVLTNQCIYIYQESSLFIFTISLKELY